VTVKLQIVFLTLFFTGIAWAAPPADPELVDLWSHTDELNAANHVPKAAAPRALKRARSAPDLGLNSLLNDFLDANRNTGLLVLKGDTVVAERYQYGRTAQHRFASASMAKTVLGMLVGIAVHERKIASIEDRAEKYVPALKGHPYGQTSIRDLLTMSSGVEWHEAYGWDRDQGLRLIENTFNGATSGGADTVLEFNRREAPAGTRFHYASGDSEVLGLVLRAAVGMPLAQYLSEKIWQPMGAEADATWLVDRAGNETGFCCINATLRDFGRFGLLLANGGARDGKQIIPAAWVKAATRPSALHLRVGFATLHNGYGYQTWILNDGRARAGGQPIFAAFGVRGQAIYVDPASKVVVVHTAVWDENVDRDARVAQYQLWGRILKTLSQKERAA
jgi:CubicO group peptidase (beta-lactamase class C family)